MTLTVTTNFGEIIDLRGAPVAERSATKHLDNQLFHNGELPMVHYSPLNL